MATHGLDRTTAAGGTGSPSFTLPDPNADRIVFWDDSASEMAYLTLGAGLVIIGTTVQIDLSSALTLAALTVTGSTALNGAVTMSAGATVSGGIIVATGDLTVSAGHILRGSATQDIGASAAPWRTGYFLTSLISPKVSATASGVGALDLSSGSTGDINLNTNNDAQTQVQISHTAFANRYLILTGSNGDNPTISTSLGNLKLTSGSGDIQWGPGLIALGGGATPVLGTIGGAGPATAAQNTWMRILDSTGATFWVPTWK